MTTELLNAAIGILDTLDSDGSLTTAHHTALILRRTVYATRLAEKDAAIAHLAKTLAEREDELRRLGQATVALSDNAYRQQLGYEAKFSEFQVRIAELLDQRNQADKQITTLSEEVAYLTEANQDARQQLLELTTEPVVLPVPEPLSIEEYRDQLATTESTTTCRTCNRELPDSRYPHKNGKRHGRICLDCQRRQTQARRAATGETTVCQDCGETVLVQGLAMHCLKRGCTPPDVKPQQTAIPCPGCGAPIRGESGKKLHMARTGCSGVAPTTLEKVAPPAEEEPITPPARRPAPKVGLLLTPIVSPEDGRQPAPQLGAAKNGKVITATIDDPWAAAWKCSRCGKDAFTPSPSDPTICMACIEK